MKHIFYLILISVFMGCTSEENGKDKVWNSLFWNQYDISQLKFVGDSVHYIDNNLMEHRIHTSELSSYSFPSKDTLLIDSIPLFISTTPYYSGISLPFLYSTSNSTKSAGTNFSISYDSVYGYGTPYYHSNPIKYKDFYNITHPLHAKEINPYATLFIDHNLPIQYFDSMRFEITKYGPQNVNMKSKTGNCFFKLHFPWKEELDYEVLNSFTLPPPPNVYPSICEVLNDTLFNFIDLSTGLDYISIVNFTSSNPKNVIVLLYDETNTVEYVFQPYFRLFHEIYLVRNEYSVREYQTEYNNLEQELRKEVRKKFPIRIRLANKKLLGKCD